MNKIIIDNNTHSLNNFKGCIAIKSESTKLDITGLCKIYLKSDFSDLELNICDSAKLELYLYNNGKKNNSSVVINQHSNTELKLVDIFNSFCDIKESIVVNVLGEDNFSDIKIRVVQNNAHSEIKEQINAVLNSKNNVATESLKGLVCGGEITVVPNMEINTNNIVANHFVTISSYDKDEINYMMSKGISLKSSQELIKSGYLFSGIDEGLKEVFYE